MFRVYLIKVIRKLIHLAKKYKPAMKVLSLDQFYTLKFLGDKPNSDYFLHRKIPKFFFDSSNFEPYVNYLKEKHPRAVSKTLTKAEDALNHTFNFLGSGETDLGRNINWHQDFISGKSWKNDHYTKIQIINPSDDSDIKVPWELSRLQHFTDLGKAFWITEDEAYLREFVVTMNHWEKENRIGYGPNWTCPMDVAIRAINMIWGLYFFSAKNLLSENFIQRAIRLLYYHGLHIEQNLEKIEDGSNSNHLLSNYLGLFYIGLLFPEFDHSQKWRQIACNGLEKEILLEVNSDGVDYECSTSYHRLVLEIFLSAYILGKKNSYQFSDKYKNRLKQMIHFSESITSTSGKTPLVGDNDDGFIIKLSHDDPSSHKHLIELGAELFNTPLPSFVNKTEESLFYFGLSTKECTKKKTVKSSFFKESGYAVIRSDKLHLLFSATKLSQKALGGHKHNDNLAFTLEYNNIPYFIDSGTYCYTSNFDKRNNNRSVVSHNTVSIDSEEQDRFFDSRLFYLFNDSKSEIDLWTNIHNNVIVSGIHHGYERNNLKIIHRRTIQVNLKTSLIEIRDEITGDSNKEHLFETRFITPVENVIMQKNGLINICEGIENSLTMSFDRDENEKIEISESEYFPKFGVSKPSQVITRIQKSKLPLINKTTISMVKKEELIYSQQERINRINKKLESV